MKHIQLKDEQLNFVRTVDPRLVSYNIEMTEVTGGTFWKAYTPEQVAGTEPFLANKNMTDFTSAADLVQVYPPIDLYNEKLRYLALELSPAWIRVSGTWATKTYYDFEGTTGGIPPKGYQSVLTKEQWIGVLDFVKAVNGKLLVSVSNCEGDHPNGGELDLTQAKKLFAFSAEYGVPIAAAEFTNEPTMLEVSGLPKGYTARDYTRDSNIFYGFVKDNYPDCLIVGPCPVDIGLSNGENAMKYMGDKIPLCSTDELMQGAEILLDVYSYHYYNGASERIASIAPSAHWGSELAHTDAYLSVAERIAKEQTKYRDRYVCGGQMWVTESGDAGGGGNTWASTYLDVFRTLNELGSFCRVTDGVIFHNTLASSDYGFLEHGSFNTRPNYYAALLWTRVMGQEVYDCKDMEKENLHVYCHSRKDGKNGYSYCIINNSLTDSVEVKTPKNADIYLLGATNLRASVMQLNGQDLQLVDGKLCEIQPKKQDDGTLILPPMGCAFIRI